MKDYILSWNQKSVLKRLGFLRKYGFYLAGGTALALQLGHRTSKDLDFYTPKHFDSSSLIRGFRKQFGKEIIEASRAPDTAYLTVKSTDLSFFRYPYKLIRRTIPYFKVNLASPEDIAAMKIEALISRGVKRDFVDIYFLIEKYSIEQVLEFTKEKYPETFNEQTCLDGLMYFQDAEVPQKSRKRVYIYDNISWKEIKASIQEKVKKYQLSKL